MPNIIKYYIKFIDYISLKTGRATMYLVFVMMFILILSFVTRNIINIPLIWIIEMAQFVMTGYYLLGGGYSLLSDDHVRMDLIYSRLKDRTKAMLDMITSIFLINYSIVRFLIEYLREPDIQIGIKYNLFTQGQILSIPILFIGLMILYSCLYNKK